MLDHAWAMHSDGRDDLVQWIGDDFWCNSNRWYAASCWRCPALTSHRTIMGCSMCNWLKWFLCGTRNGKLYVAFTSKLSLAMLRKPLIRPDQTKTATTQSCANYCGSALTGVRHVDVSGGAQGSRFKCSKILNYFCSHSWQITLISKPDVSANLIIVVCNWFLAVMAHVTVVQ